MKDKNATPINVRDMHLACVIRDDVRVKDMEKEL